MSDREVGWPLEILLVEDNLADIRLTQEALSESRIVASLNVVTDGVKALTYLRREGRHSGAAVPDLILLDLNLPRKSGRELLAEIKADPSLARIPVVILTTSIAEEDIAGCYDLHANCYIAKPVDLERFIAVVRAIGDFWFGIVRLPPSGRDRGRR